MNWKEIKEKYYKAWFLLGSEKYSGYWGAIDNGNLRLLYDFFDERELFIEIQPYIAGGQPVFYFQIIYRNERFVDTFFKDENLCCHNRSVAETLAFTEAFRILNDKLKTNE